MQQTFPSTENRTLRADDILVVLRNSLATSAELEAALAGIGDATTDAEAEVEQLEARRNRMLVVGRVNHPDMDDLERQIRVANRVVETLSIAREELPSRIAARRAREEAVSTRTEKAQHIQQQVLGAYVKAHGHAERLAELLRVIRQGEDEIRAANLDVHDLGAYGSTVALPIQQLASHLQCRLSDLPAVAEWKLPGYLSPRCRDDRLLDRARELLERPITRAA